MSDPSDSPIPTTDMAAPNDEPNQANRWSDRLYLAVQGTESRDAQAKLRSLGWLLLVYAPLDSATLASSLPAGSPGRWRATLLVAGCVMALLLAFRESSRRLALGLTFALLGSAYWWIFPGNSNHRFLVLMCLAILTFLDLGKDREALLALGTLRFMTALVLFYSGMQKVFYGTYWHGEFLAWQVAWEPRFARIFGALISAEELTRLQSMTSLPAEQQIYRTRAPILLAASWSTLLFELALPVLLLLRRTRSVAVGLTLVLLISIETAALELSFGVIFVSLALLFTKKNWNGRLLVPFAAILALVFFGRIGLVPWGAIN